MPAAVRAGGWYFLIIFACGFAVGAARALALEPRIGKAAAVAVEAPAMLALSWVAAGRVMRGAKIGSRGDALAMGATAFSLLMCAEFALGLAIGMSPADIAADYSTAAGLLGLCAQIGFALVPAARAARAGRHD